MIVAARRTPIGTRGRSLRSVTVEQLAAPVIRALVDDGADALGGRRPVADVVLGNCMGPGGNPARVAALAAGLGSGVPGMTVDRQCGSGLAAIVEAATAVRAGDERMRVAGGVESASTAPVRSIDGVAYERAPFAPQGTPDPDMTLAADDLARAFGLSRERQDAYTARSHRRARVAVDRGAFDEELVPLAALAVDDAITAVGANPADGANDTASIAVERLLPRFPPLFDGGSVTAGNSCRVNDGAAAALIVPGRVRGDAPGLALRAHATVGCDPALPGLGAAPAIAAALDRSGHRLADVAAFEIVEAFAAQLLAVLTELGLPDTDARVCADGGALALGHPWGASGAVSVVRLFSRLVRAGAPAGTVGVAAASIGGGMGVAAVFEVVR
ncbi:thiolase family protein [Leifsonia poae]|uniref:Acetyl-CoA acetyltransferase n=1 Tax=Leifsonia poae TaxID=110933 RepID=A0A9W6H7Z0_9MICO|nr:acetyl-CoA acetyltransferase [Leifsonia poae]